MGFANPAALAASIFIAGLVLLYLWERTRQRFDVPSLLFWEKVPEAIVRRNRFQPDTLFWLQLAALAALVLGWANPYRSGAPASQGTSRILLVFDLSASMQAVEGGVTRFDMARAEALQIIESAESNARITLITASREASVIDRFTDDRPGLIQFVHDLEPRDLSKNLEPALLLARRLATQSNDPVEIHVLTDARRESVDRRWHDGMNWWPFGTTDDNLAIVAVETSHAVLSRSRSADVHVTVRNFSQRERHGALTLAVNDEVVGVELFTAPAETDLGFLFSGLTAAGRLEASLRDDDALAVDNRWRSWLPPPRPKQVAVVSSHPDLRSLLSRIEGATGFVLMAADAEQRDDADADLVIFHHSVPDHLPAAPVLLIAPETAVDSLEPLAQLDGAEIVDWDDNHASLRGIDPRSFPRFASIRALTTPDWGDTVVTAISGRREVPLVVTGRPAAQRVAIIAVDLAEAALLTTDQESTLLLFLNLLDWLTSEVDQVPVVRTGQSIELGDGEESPPEVVDPRGRRVNLEPGPRPVLDLTLAGTYEIRRPERETQSLLVNFNDVVESNIGRSPAQVHRVEPDHGDRGDAVDGGGLRNWLYLVAACVLLIEWQTAVRVHSDG